jgi:hypothetical protein
VQRWAIVVLLALAATVAAQGCKGSCTTNADCPSGGTCLYPQGSCSAQGTCQYRNGAAECGLVTAVCGCNGSVVTSPCGWADGYWTGPTLGPTAAPASNGTNGLPVCGDAGAAVDAGCVVAGGKCEATVPCCTGTCTDTGTCECLPNGAACHGACCSTYCDINGNCACQPTGQSCDLDPARAEKECCHGLCAAVDGGDGGTGTCP